MHLAPAMLKTVRILFDTHIMYRYFGLASKVHFVKNVCIDGTHYVYLCGCCNFSTFLGVGRDLLRTQHVTFHFTHPDLPILV